VTFDAAGLAAGRPAPGLARVPGVVPRARREAGLEGAVRRGKLVDAEDGAAIRQFFETYFVPNLVRAPDGADAA
jgi:hypothetical protein